MALRLTVAMPGAEPKCLHTQRQRPAQRRTDPHVSAAFGTAWVLRSNAARAARRRSLGSLVGLEFLPQAQAAAASPGAYKARDPNQWTANAAAVALM
jgi:hypothetical protein